MKFNVFLVLIGWATVACGQTSISSIPTKLKVEADPSRGHYKLLAALSPDPKSSSEEIDKLKFPYDPAFASKVLSRKPVYLKDVTVDDFRIPPPPANSSAQTRAELNYLLGLQHNRTDEDIRSSLYLSDHQSESTSPSEVGRRIGYWTSPQKMPLLDNLTDSLSKDATYFLYGLKFKFNRPRPFMLEPQIHDMEESRNSAYPGGHAVFAYIAAYFYADLAPEYAGSFLEWADEMCRAREIIGVHYPSDLEASRLFARQFMNKLFQNERFMREFELAKKEWAARVNENAKTTAP